MNDSFALLQVQRYLRRMEAVAKDVDDYLDELVDDVFQRDGHGVGSREEVANAIAYQQLHRILEEDVRRGGGRHLQDELEAMMSTGVQVRDVLKLAKAHELEMDVLASAASVASSAAMFF